jgi:two-component system, chemotaxis family, CheB/CheR fusion protein
MGSVAARAHSGGDHNSELRIVGIGASAGGLEAIEAFLANTTADSGLAYIVVQHLDPTRKTLLAELLQRVSPIPVTQAVHGMHVSANHAYVIPPDAELTLDNFRLMVRLPEARRGLRLPINVLFSSLASAIGEKAIGVILSGMGSDGVRGMQAIKEAGGLTLVQDPALAQFDAMPKSVIAADCADVISAPESMPSQILALIDDSGHIHTKEKYKAIDDTEVHLDQIVSLLHQRTRHDFSQYKPSTLTRRIARRVGIHGMSSTASYVDLLKRSEQESELLFKELLIGVTNFFRDPAVWEYLSSTILPRLLQERQRESNLRAWSVGCSTGEEAYSLAMLLAELKDNLDEDAAKHLTIQVFASDISPDAIVTARRGRYALSISADVSADRLNRFFTRHESHYQVSKTIRDMVLFAQHDVMLDPPFTRLDVIVCRNLLIYFDQPLQRRLLPLFHYSLREGGALVLGSSETVGRFSSLFSALHAKRRCYKRIDQQSARLPLHSIPPLSISPKEYSVPTTDPASANDSNLQSSADRVLLQLYAPAAVMVNTDGDIVYISGHTGKYLEPAAGKANWNFHAMAREGLRAPLAAALSRSADQSAPIQLKNLRVEMPWGGTQAVDITIQRLHEPSALHGMTMIVFRDTRAMQTGHNARKGKSTRGVAGADLQQYRDEIQALRDEARISHENLETSNHELQSINEELQSTNEELTTSREEMQSMNEELQTINNELQTKLDDLALAQSDLQNTLNSIEIAILFLDQNLNVRRYTELAQKIISLRQSDIGRPLSDLSSSLQLPDINDIARDTLRSLMPFEKEVPANDGRWFSVRIIPYRTLDNIIDGVVITLVDITNTKLLEAALREHQE